MLKTLYYITGGLSALYALCCVLIYLFQERLLFHPSPLPEGYTFRIKNAQDFFIESGKARLNALFIRAEADSPKGVILYFHGNAGSLEGWGQVAAEFTKFSYDVCVMDYRSYGKSTGKITQKALYQDGQLFYDYLKQHYPEEKITVYGRSLGTAIATKISADNTPAQLILESPFHSMQRLAQAYLPFLPTRYLLRYPLPSASYFTQIACPVTIIHGAEDQTVPASSGRELYESRQQTQKVDFMLIPEAGHNDLAAYTEYWDIIEQKL